MEEASRIQKETEERVAAAVLTQGYIADLLPSVLEGLKEAGYFIDDIKQGQWNIARPDDTLTAWQCGYFGTLLLNIHTVFTCFIYFQTIDEVVSPKIVLSVVLLLLTTPNYKT